MAWQKEHKQQSRQNIVEAAASLFTELGFDHVSIDDVMLAAGLTRGAFYAHFNSKSELYAEAISHAARCARDRVMHGLQEGPSVADIATRYLMLSHAEGKTTRCPLAFLTSDIHQRDEQVRDAYTQVLKGFIAAVRATSAKGDPDKEIRNAVLMIGGLALARAINEPELQERVLQACRDGVF
ncbi:TetR/AcrR family transcriptional regulator [Gilvimarinus sp. SDUM040013]|uniref:TetR/AcrR family transcriptional regulator n=1 Tax=Gilvimarinus gilvus TaxID=3058038 RepID=A0ABU4RVH3_9GAMM|nr:TetR/AcrR family transcriptional regulator [Gilvimarinus sp. SDUM040013]MDO3386799.1 TetR/AcrR family transcriptional regulator [Gilvimarinus sp. SDUM040013]MDX6848271.1 TetR/AcrR family transcriptional regulator [Gilvimarinus sp. SDUM040013]